MEGVEDGEWIDRIEWIGRQVKTVWGLGRMLWFHHEAQYFAWEFGITFPVSRRWP